MDEFSFPTIVADQHPLSHFPFSPWSLPSEQNPMRHRKSFSSVEESLQVSLEAAHPLQKDLGPNSPVLSENGYSERFLEHEETMDILWEDFNEEIRRAHHSPEKSPATATPRSQGMVELRRLMELGSSKKGRMLHHRRRPSLVVMLKVLKKLFLVQKASSKRTSR